MQNEKTKTFKCPACDAALKYGGAGNMTCEYCGAEIEAAAFFDEDDDSLGASSWEKYGDKARLWQAEEGATLFSCTSCGGEIICEDDTAATVCPYCDNPALVSSRLDGIYKPDAVLPFSVKREDAAGILDRFSKKKPLLPSSFRKQNKLESLRGVYVPFWLYDCDTLSRFVFSAMRKTSWRSGDYRYTRTSYYRLYRRGRMSFSDIPVDASVAMDNTMLESIEPFDFSQTSPLKRRIFLASLPTATTTRRSPVPCAPKSVSTQAWSLLSAAPSTATSPSPPPCARCRSRETTFAMRFFPFGL